MKSDKARENSDLFIQDLAGEDAVRSLFALVRWRFRELEEADGFTQQQLATRMGMPRSQVSRLLASPSNMTLRSASRILMAMGRKLELSAVDPLAHQAITAHAQVYQQSAATNINVVPFIPRRVPTRQVFTAVGPQRAAAADGPSQGAIKYPDSTSGNLEDAVAEPPPTPVEIGEFIVPQGAFRLLLDGATILVELSDDSPAHMIFLGNRRHELKASTTWPGAFEIIGFSDDEADQFVEAYQTSGAKAGWV